jgi:hypothetical protein
MQWLLDHFVLYIEQGFIFVANALIASLGSFLGVISGLLPSMPGQPSIPGAITTAMRVAYEAGDVGWLLAYIATFFALMAGVYLVMIPLRWIKAAE